MIFGALDTSDDVLGPLPRERSAIQDTAVSGVECKYYILKIDFYVIHVLGLFSEASPRYHTFQCANTEVLPSDFSPPPLLLHFISLLFTLFGLVKRVSSRCAYARLPPLEWPAVQLVNLNPVKFLGPPNWDLLKRSASTM